MLRQSTQQQQLILWQNQDEPVRLHYVNSLMQTEYVAIDIF